jgi:hypothetical protein
MTFTFENLLRHDTKIIKRGIVFDENKLRISLIGVKREALINIHLGQICPEPTELVILI